MTLRGYKQGRPEKDANMACLTLDEIAKELNTSKRNLQRALRIERNLTDSMKELERLYGVRVGSLNEKGNNRIGEPNNSDDQITQADLASQLGISVDTLQNYKILSDMIPELEE